MRWRSRYTRYYTRPTYIHTSHPGNNPPLVHYAQRHDITRIVQLKRIPLIYIACRKPFSSPYLTSQQHKIPRPIIVITPPSALPHSQKKKKPLLLLPSNYIHLYLSQTKRKTKMQLPRILSPAFCCLLTSAAQHVAGLALPGGEAPTVCPSSCLEILPTGYTPEVITSWFQSECGYETLFKSPVLPQQESIN